MRADFDDHLATQIADYLSDLGFEVGEDGRLRLAGKRRGGVREVLKTIRKSIVAGQREWIRNSWDRLSRWLADGESTDPERIRPNLIRVEKGIHSDLFRLVRLLKGLPPTQGVGRRLRYLIVDRGNTGRDGTPYLIGAIGLQSPPISFPPRDRKFVYPPGKKRMLVNQTMHLYTFGAVPPYDRLEAERLAVLMAASRDVRLEYARRYEGRTTLINEEVIPAHMVALTAVVAGGEADPFDGLLHRGRRVAIPLGETSGYSALHLEPFYQELRRRLRASGWNRDSGFGSGPRWKWRVLTLALRRIGLSSEVMYHGIPGKAYLIPMIRNLKEFMEGDGVVPEYIDLPVSARVAAWRSTWLRRAAESDEWRSWRRENLIEILLESP